MNYNFTLLTTLSDCDNLLSLVGKDRSYLEFHKTSLERQRESYGKNSVETSAELQAVNTELAALNTMIPGLPEGDTKKDNTARQKRLEVKQFILTGRNEDYGVVALLEKESDIGRTEKQIAEIDAFIAGINARKAQL